MCGIAGALTLPASRSRGGDWLASRVRAMTTAISHRGPDDEGLWVHANGTLALGHRRLSIVDLSRRGHQPMHYANRFSIVFNGEIYNFRPLRDELQTAGHSFASGTDTEVILAAVQEWGIDRALHRMVGMFAFALWDNVDQVLYLARDRLGEKPVHFGVQDGAFVFASELRAIEAWAGTRLRIASSAVSEYLRHGYVRGPLSMYEGIYKLPPATYLRIGSRGDLAFDIDKTSGAISTSGAASLHQYWFVRSQKQESAEAEALTQLQELLRTAVKEQMECDVPTGVFLSGGIDSTAIAAMAQSVSASPISTFTVKFDAPGFDESSHASAVARHLGTHHHEIAIGAAELVESIPVQAGLLDEPTGNASYFALRLMSQAARRHVKVVLSGDAGDELFGGYNRYVLAPALWKRFSMLPSFARRSLAQAMGKLPNALLSYLTQRAGASAQADAGVAIKKMIRFLDEPQLWRGYQRLMHCWDDPSTIAYVDRLHENRSMYEAKDFLTGATADDLLHYLPDDNLAKADRATMAASLEQRVPLLDHRVVEFARTLPDSLLIRDGRGKWLLRQLAYRHVPADILDRPKMGFTAPIRTWLTGPLREWAGDLLHSEALLESGLLKKNVVGRQWAALLNADASNAWEIWSLVVYVAWLGSRDSGSISAGALRAAQ